MRPGQHGARTVQTQTLDPGVAPVWRWLLQVWDEEGRGGWEGKTAGSPPTLRWLLSPFLSPEDSSAGLESQPPSHGKNSIGWSPFPTQGTAMPPSPTCLSPLPWALHPAGDSAPPLRRTEQRRSSECRARGRNHEACLLLPGPGIPQARTGTPGARATLQAESGSQDPPAGA